ncbi:MAG: hypothetical protein A2987_00015 [Omnitrophica bacterium RIFCSPLOWO2_01_FULL_45_10]|nr:MAG: hypothetical protein A2987_00015 [Omnitrophica bacterium RIFCSPLOWO2_01_FULL_45_10]
MSENINEIITLFSYPNAIVHIDCDAFFASCEQAQNPSLKGRPVVTGKERGIISSASYEAKALGIKRGVSLREAKRMCPELIVLPSDYETYSIYSERVFDIVRRFTPTVEEFSIDEAFCDLTGLRRIYRTSYSNIARKIKDAIHKELDITVSMGLSPTKTLAKICSRHKKPKGFTAAPGYRLHLFLKDTALDTVCGFGPNTVALLNKCGVFTVLDYVKRPLEFADKLLGKIGRELWHELRGTMVYHVSPGAKEKYLSISKTKTFSPGSDDREFVKSHVMRNLEAAFIKLRRHKLSAKALTVYLRTIDFNGGAIKGELDRHSSSTLDFTGLCDHLFDLIFKRKDRDSPHLDGKHESGGSPYFSKDDVSYRATGVVLSDIVIEGVDSRTLFDDPIKIAKVTKLSKTVDDINMMYGKYAVHLATSNMALGNRKINRDSPHLDGNPNLGDSPYLSPRSERAWRKTHLLKGETSRSRLRIPLLKF